MAIRFPNPADLIAIPIRAAKQLSADDAEAGYGRAPSDGEIVGIDLGCDKIGGGTPPTGLDTKVTAKTGVAAARELMASRAAVVAGSAVVKGGVAATLHATRANLMLVEGDLLTLDADMTGGATPTADGVWALVYLRPSR